MKRQLCSLVLTGLLATGVMLAQEPGSAPEQAAPQGNMAMHGHGRMDADQRLAHMTKRYKLTSDQQNQIKPILQDEQQQMMSMHSDTAMSRQDKMAKMQSMHQDSNQKIEAALTDEQRQKFDADQQKMQARRAAHTGSMQGGAPTADPSAPPPPQQ